MPWSAPALQEGSARDPPLFAGALHAHRTLKWVFRRLVRCQTRRHGENKGTWRRESERGGAWTWRRLNGEPLSPVPARCAVRDRTFPRGPAALGHAGMVPPVAAGEGGPLCGLVDCTPSPPAARLRPRCAALVRGVGGWHVGHRHRVRQGGRPCRGRPGRAHRRHGGPRGGPNGLHAILDSNGSCPSARSTHLF